MSTTAAANLTVAIVLFTGAAAYWRITTAQTRHHVRQQSQEHDVGPDALQLLEDLDQHLDEYLLDHPDVAAGFDRLRNAVRDEQQKGEQ